MSESIKKLDEVINSFISWKKEYPNQIITSNQKKLLVNLLKKVMSIEALSQNELQKIDDYSKIKNLHIDEIIKEEDSIEGNLPKRIFRFKCEGCGRTILMKDKYYHRDQCKKWKKLIRHNDPIIDIPESSNSTSITNDLPGKTYNLGDNELKNEGLTNRRLDGGRSYFQRRDGGKFGSYPSMDDFGDESNP